MSMKKFIQKLKNLIIEVGMNKLTEFEQQDLKKIENLYYMKPILKTLYELIERSQIDWIGAFNKIHEILIKSRQAVENILKEREKRSEINSKNQALKSIAGNAFSNCLIYIFLKNKIEGNIKPYIYITSNKSKIKGFNKMSTIKVGKETQKPDVDIIIYTKKTDDSIDKCVFLSLKTSLRERAGQTYRWKLLLEIATSDNPIKEKYKIQYESIEMPIICFATVNFYNEINNPQHRGMLKFFDKAFIAKDIKSEFVSPLSELINFVNRTFG